MLKLHNQFIVTGKGYDSGCPLCQECQELSGILEILSSSQENVRKVFHISNLSRKFQGNVRNFWFCLVVSTFKSYIDIDLVCI